MSNHSLYVSVIVVLLGAMYTWLLIHRENFRKNVMPGDIVGIKFGDYVVNRKIYTVTQDTVSVQAYEGTHTVEVPKTRVYIKSEEF